MPRYTHDVRERGFRIYYQTRNISEVVRALKAEYPKLSKSTVHEWSLERDARGKTWDDRTKETEVAHHDKLDANMAGTRREILSEAMLYKEKLVSELPELRAKTLEGSIFAFDKIASLILKQSGSDRDSEQTARESVSTLLLVLKEDKEIGPVLERRWDQIEKRFYEVLKKIRKSEAKK